jgi:hypothetical protein
VYCAIVQDTYSRKVVGRSIDSAQTATRELPARVPQGACLPSRMTCDKNTVQRGCRGHQ